MKMILEKYGELEFKDLEPMDSNRFLEFTKLNPDFNIELDKYGNIVVMSPVNTRSSNYESAAVAMLFNWNYQTGAGYVSSSQGGFTLSNGAVRVADAAWVEKSRMDSLPSDEMERFAAICPDFIIEIRSKSDYLKPLQQKMEEWMENGCRLAFLIDPIDKQAFICRAGEAPEHIAGLDGTLGGDDVLPGFELSLQLFA